MTRAATIELRRAGPLQGKIGVGLTAAGMLTVLAWMGHRLVFSQFQRYDDEGYLLITVRQFLDGHPLYDEVYTQYGPAYYLWQVFLRDLLGIPLTHEATRIVTLVMWLLCSALVGVPVWLLTRRPLLTALAGAAAFFHLTQLTFEPGHPQELCFPAALAAVIITVWRLVVFQNLGLRASMFVGALVAVAALTKVNIGVFLAGALSIALVTSMRPHPWRAAFIRVVTAAAFLGVAAMMFRDLARPDIAAAVLVVWIGLVVALIANAEHADDQGVVTGTELVGAAAGFGLVATVVVVGIVAYGTTLRSLIDGLLVWPLRFPAVFWQELPVPFAAVAAAILWLGFAESRRREVSFVRSWMPFAALFIGQLLFVLSITKAFALLFAFGPPLAWLVLGNPPQTGGELAARRLLLFATIFLALQTYPMPAGTQIAMGTVLYVPIALVTIADAEWAIRGGKERRPGAKSTFRRLFVGVLLVLVVGLIAYRFQRDYAQGVSLKMPGAEAIRVPEKEAARYWWLTTNLKEHCSTFLMGPGLNSLYFWTGLKPVTTLNATLWSLLFDDTQQRRVLDAARPLEDLCVVWEPRIMAFLMSLPGMSSGPLAVWMAQEFRPVALFDRWEFRIPRGASIPALYQARWSDNDAIELHLPPLGGADVARFEVVDAETGTTLADTREGLVVFSEAKIETALLNGLDVSTARRIVMRGTIVAPSSDQAAVIVRLWTRDERLITVVPVVVEGSRLPTDLQRTGPTQ